MHRSLLTCVSLLAALFIPSTLRAQFPAWHWANMTGLGQTSAVAVDPATDFIYIAGRFTNTGGFGGTFLTTTGADDLFVAKLRRDGTYLWAVQATGVNDDAATALAVDANGNVWVAGEFSSPTLTFGSGPGAITVNNSGTRTEVFVAHLSSTGSVLAATSAGGQADDLLSSLALDGSGNVYVAGHSYSGTADFGSTTLTTTGNGDAYVAKLNAQGTWQWAVAPEGTGEDLGLAVAADAAGNVYVTGRFISPDLTFDNTTLTRGSRPSGTPFLAKLNTNGSWQWAQIPGEPGAGIGTGLAVDAQGDVVLVGTYDSLARFGATLPLAVAAGSDDVFVAKANSNGVWQWASRAGGTGTETATGVTLDAAGNVFITGWFNSPSAPFGGTTLQYNAAGAVLRADVFVARLSATGFWQWAAQTNSTVGAFNRSTDLAVDSRGDAIVTGVFASPTLLLNPVSLNNPTGFGAAFIAKVGVTGVGLPEDHDVSALNFYPNPARQFVRVTNPPAGPVLFFDAVGRAVRVVTPPASDFDIPLEGLAPGHYTVRCGKVARPLIVMP